MTSLSDLFPLRSLSSLIPLSAALLLTMGGETALAQDPPSPVKVPQFEAPPVIDGVLSEPAWKKGSWSTGFTVVGPSGQAAREKTHFQFGIDAQYLYVAIVLDGPRTGVLTSKETERDGSIWQDDAVELALHPVPSMDQYLHLIVNSAGVIYDALRVQGGNLADSTVDLSAQVATKVSGGSWTLEMAIPLAELGLTQDAGRTWAFNVARTSFATGKAEVSSFARMTGDLHQPNQFAALEVEALDVSPFLWSLTPHGDTRVMSEGGKLMLETQVSIENRTGAYAFFDLDFVVRQGSKILGRLSEPRGLDASAARLQRVRIPMEGEGAAMVDLTLRNAASGAPLARLRYPAQVSYTPLRLTLTSPSYRNTVYASQKLDAVRGKVEIYLPEERLAKGTLSVRLENERGAVLGESRISQLAPSVNFEIPAPSNWPVGDYRVRAVLQASEETRETVVNLGRLGPLSPGREVRLDENKVTLVDGKPFLPFGAMMLRPREDLETVAAQGYTVVMEYTFYYWTDDAKQAWLDRLQKLGLMAVIYPYPKPEMAKGAALRKPLLAEELAEIRKFVTRWKNHPALLAWYLADEPELHSTLPERLHQLDQVCREADPYHPTIVLNNTPGGIDTYGEYCDILMPNPFPGFYEGGEARRSIEYAYSLVRHAALAQGGSRGVWMTPQAFSWADVRAERANERPPNFRDMRSMYYQGIIAGSKGFIPYSYQHGRRHPSIRLGLGYLARELEGLKEAVLAPDESGDFAGSREGILHSLRRVGKETYVFAVNTTQMERDFVATVPEATWHVVSEDRTLRPENGRLHDRLPPLATRIYTTDAAVAHRLHLEAAERLILEAPLLPTEETPLPEQERPGLPTLTPSPTR